MKVVVRCLRVTAAVEQAHTSTHHTHHVFDNERTPSSRCDQASATVVVVACKWTAAAVEEEFLTVTNDSPCQIVQGQRHGQIDTRAVFHRVLKIHYVFACDFHSSK